MAFSVSKPPHRGLFSNIEKETLKSLFGAMPKQHFPVGAGCLFHNKEAKCLHPCPKPNHPLPSHPAPPAAAPAEPYALHNPAAVQQHIRGLGDQEVLRLHTSGTTQRTQAITLVQAASLGDGVRDFLFDAFLHVAQHDRPPLATPDGESQPPTGDRIWVAPIDWGRHLVGHPVPERENTQGRNRYREPNMAHAPPSATPSNTKGWERETWVARMASLSIFRHHVPGDIPSPDDRQPAPSTYMTLMYNLH